MLDSSKVMEASSEDFIVKAIIAKDVDGRHQTLSPSLQCAF